MIKILDYLFRFCFFLVLLYGPALGIAYIFGDLEAVRIVFFIVSSLVLIDLVRMDRILNRYLRPRAVLLANRKLYEIDDPSAHLFITRAPLRETRIWITRGLLTLLSHREIEALIHELEIGSRSLRLSFETYLTVLGIRFSKGIHPKVQDALFIAKLGRRNFTITQFVISLPTIGILSLLGRLYRSSEPRKPFETNEMRLVMTTLLREATFSPPSVHPILANHSLIAPWPNALLTLGRPCLHSETGVDLRHDFQPTTV